MAHLINANEIATYGRPMSKHIENDILNALIRETEDTDIKPVIGDDFYAYLVTHLTEEPTVLFLNGGRWNETDDPTYDESFEEFPDFNHFRFFCGLKASIAYYVQAKLIKANDSQLTRFGLVKKDESHSSNPSSAERNALYNDFNAIADKYLDECRRWLNEHSYYFPAHTLFAERIKANRVKYKVRGK